MVVSTSSGRNSSISSIIEESSTSTVSSRSSMISKAALRRRRSKGTIAGFASPGKVNSPGASGELTVGDLEEHSGAMIITTNAQGTQQASSDSSSAPAKPCHSARLALMCSQNAIRMGARTQLGLCPPGRARRSLKAALRQKSRTMRSSFARRSSQTPTDVGGYFGVDKMIGAASLEDYPAKEEDFLMSTNSFDIESDEEASSGDDDDLLNVEDLLKEDSPALDDEKKYSDLMEPLFTPNGAEASAGAGPMTGAGGDNGKLPFNRRKLRYFDSIFAADTMAARKYLATETRKSKQKEVVMLAKRLRRIQREEKRKLIIERGGIVEDADMDYPESDDALVAAGVAKFEHPMTPATAAALVIESLSLNPLESIEGMAKCYEGIVAAGVALLESNRNDPTSPASTTNERSMATRTEIVAALTPLLITSLEQTSGEVILSLARIRRMCGTPRYQRRFVQRVAPSLIRPPSAALWCLKHQNDMEPILAAVELMFDCSVEIFSKGWYERGQLLLADTKRAETLNTAAMQLRNLSTGPEDHFSLGGSMTSHGTWRASKYKDASKSKGSNDQLAEWEVIAVDIQIRLSISKLISMDWPKVVVNSKDSDAARALYKSRSSSKRSHSLASSGEASPKSMVAPAQSPARTSSTKAPMSPHGPPLLKTSFPSDSSTDHSFPTSFPSGFDVPMSERFQSPAPPTFPKALPAPDPSETGMLNELSTSSNMFPPSLPPGHTPPRSPTLSWSPKREISGDSPGQGFTISSEGAASPLAARSNHYPQNVGSPSAGLTQFEKDHAPLSPSSPAASTNDANVPHRPISSAMSIGSSSSATGSQPAHYRMLTSTAAERKRTVAACRALRAQITRFEDAFVQLHGRPPKGAAERAPLATTYAQYREWKRAIRADAACRIQALFRGARTRWMLLRSSDPQMLRVVKSRAGRSGSLGYGSKHQTLGQDSSLERLQIPAEIGEGNQQGSRASTGSSDPFNDLAAKSQPLPPQWGSNQSLRRPRPANDGFPSPIPKHNSSSASGSSSTSTIDYTRLALPDLQAHKRDLKQQLKQYDMTFARRHGRMPVKAEKEPIRHLYEQYNALKSEITSMEQEGRQSGSASPVPSSSSVLPQRTLSPVSGIESGGDESPVGIRGFLKPTRSPAGPPNPAAGPLSQDLAALKAEKGRLHQMLRSYEKDFYKEHKRQVSSFADIRPVANQYRRYKEIKKAIAAFQQGGGDK